MKFGVIFGLKVVTTFERNLLSLQAAFLKDFGVILAPEMVPGRGRKVTYFVSKVSKSF